MIEDNNSGSQGIEGAQDTAAVNPQGFLGSLPPDLQSEASLKDFKDVSALAKSYVNAQRMLGGSIRIPSADASAEAHAEFNNRLSTVPGVVRLPNADDPKGWDDFYNKLGRPESPDKYNLKAPEGFTPDNDRLSGFKNLFHQIGLTDAQASKLFEHEASNAIQMQKSMDAYIENSAKTMQKVWGADYNNRLNAAQSVVNQYRDKFPNDVEALLNSSAGSNPVLLSILGEYGKMLAEKGSLGVANGAASSFGMTPSEARERIGEIMGNSQHAYFDESNAGHNAAVEKMQKLFKAAYPG